MKNNNDKSIKPPETDEQELDITQRLAKTQEGGLVILFKIVITLCILWQCWIIGSIIFDDTSGSGAQAHYLIILLVGIDSLPVVSQIICILIAVYSWHWAVWKAICLFSIISIIYLYLLCYIIRSERKAGEKLSCLFYLFIPWLIIFDCIMSLFRKSPEK